MEECKSSDEKTTWIDLLYMAGFRDHEVDEVVKVARESKSHLDVAVHEKMAEIAWRRSQAEDVFQAATEFTTTQ
jgi:hypothetical protein